ncbi:hypothetical protein F4779DRAFT_638573 [Xylariaceae sp. FL0662B]|nr:hypothetical protein F4779DRAFT_638573 [Xylariaceae sp. FL0662B]
MSIFPFNSMPRSQALQIREEFYEAACADLGSLRAFVKENEGSPIYTNTLPARAQIREPTPNQQDQLDYLRALVAEADQLTQLLPRLATPHNLDDYGRSLELARCLVRLKETAVDWDIATAGCEASVREAKEALERADRGESLGRGLSVEERRLLRDEVRVWDEGFPDVKAAWEAVARKNTGSAGI